MARFYLLLLYRATQSTFYRHCLAACTRLQGLSFFTANSSLHRTIKYTFLKIHETLISSTLISELSFHIKNVSTIIVLQFYI
ncbi:hypothetical protein FKM82_005747 [Ascaphus truei]